MAYLVTLGACIGGLSPAPVIPLGAQDGCRRGGHGVIVLGWVREPQGPEVQVQRGPVVRRGAVVGVVGVQGGQFGHRISKPELSVVVFRPTKEREGGNWISSFPRCARTKRKLNYFLEKGFKINNLTTLPKGTINGISSTTEKLRFVGAHCMRWRLLILNTVHRL